MIPPVVIPARLWLTRLRHRATDLKNVLSFSLSPFSVVTTELAVGTSVLNISQWPGSRVGSGGFVWDGARRLASHFERHGDGCAAGPHSAAAAGRAWRGMTVLELGAGTGAAGLAASTLGADVTLTDQASFRFPVGDGDGLRKPGPADSLLDLMRSNVRDNLEALLGRKPEVSEMLWGEDAHMARLPPVTAQSRDGYNEYDLICGTDILLFESAQVALVRSLRCLSGSSTVVVIEHTDRADSSGADYPPDLQNFFRVLAEDGLWSPSVVRDHGRRITIRMVRTGAGSQPFGGTLLRRPCGETV